MSKAELGELSPQGMGAPGIFMVTGIVEDAGGLKTPTLRIVARTAPCFHAGSAATPEESLSRELLGKTSEIALTAVERRQLLAFMRELNDDAGSRRALP